MANANQTDVECDTRQKKRTQIRSGCLYSAGRTHFFLARRCVVVPSIDCVILNKWYHLWWQVDFRRVRNTAKSDYFWFQAFAVFCMLYAFFWVITRRLEFICRSFGTLCLFHIHRHLPAYEDGTECSETSAYKLRTPGNYPKESIQATICFVMSVCLSTCNNSTTIGRIFMKFDITVFIQNLSIKLKFY